MALVSREVIAPLLAGRGTKASTGVARGARQTGFKARHPRESGTDSSGSRAERAQPMKKDEKRSFPRPRGGQDAFRGKAFGGSAAFPPQVLRQGDGSRRPAAERVARLWAPPAPSRRASRGSAGGGFPGFADSTGYTRSAPDTMTLPPPGSRGGRAIASHYTIRARYSK